jgi:hypothetical protein
MIKEKLNDYVVAEKSDGVRYILVLGKDRFNNHEPYSVMVNRKMNMFQVPVYANHEYYEGSVFDGELVIETIPHMNQTRQIFLIFDAYVSKTHSLMQMPFLMRYKECNRCFDLNNKDILNDDIKKWEKIALQESKENDKIVSLGNHMALMFRPKPCVFFSNLGSLWRSIPRLLHPSDGLILTPVPTEVLTGTHHTMFKWKPVHTIDLKVEASYVRGKWEYSLFYMDGPTTLSCVEYPFEVMGQQITLQAAENSILSTTSKYYGDKNRSTYKLIGEFECKIEENVGYCYLERWRKDKSTPNNKFIIQRTLVNIIENITIEELLQLTSLQAYGFDRV